MLKWMWKNQDPVGCAVKKETNIEKRIEVPKTNNKENTQKHPPKKIRKEKPTQLSNLTSKFLSKIIENWTSKN